MFFKYNCNKFKKYLTVLIFLYFRGAKKQFIYSLKKQTYHGRRVAL